MTTSWGVSTRLIGGMIMTHADDDGLVVPPKVAPTHAVILPVTPKEETRSQVLEACEQLAKELRSQSFSGGSIRVDVDDRDLRGGEKYWGWVKKGIPLTIEVGPRDLEKGTVFVGRRDQGAQREGMGRQSFFEQVPSILEEMQANLFGKHCREENTVSIESKDELYQYFTPGINLNRKPCWICTGSLGPDRSGKNN